MNKQSISLLFTLLLQVCAVHADTVSKAVPDTLPGNGFGGLSGFMVGAAAGGPVGAVIGTSIGWIIGGQAQEVAGLSGVAYRVKRKDGSETTVRSPNKTWIPGSRVHIVGGRLVSND